MPERYPPEDPREWLNRARSDLLLARAKGEGIYFEETCVSTLSRLQKRLSKRF